MKNEEEKKSRVPNSGGFSLLRRLYGMLKNWWYISFDTVGCISITDDSSLGCLPACCYLVKMYSGF